MSVRTRVRILIVEDDQACAEMYRMALRIAGYVVDIAGDGVTALHVIERNPPDLVVLDLQLPRLRGEAIIDELSSNRHLRDVPIVVVTGAEQNEDALRGRVNAVVRKPCDPSHLAAIVERQLLERGADTPA